MADPVEHDGILVVTNRRTGATEEFGPGQFTVWHDDDRGVITIEMRSDTQHTSNHISADRFNIEYRSRPTSSSSSSCILTTACVRSLGLPDDCPELTAFRRLRDEYMVHLTSGPTIVADYYQVAPAIIHAIDNRADSDSVWLDVYKRHVVPLVRMIEVGDFENALISGESALHQLRDQHLPH